MPPPSQLSIATSSINRLVKEETTYRTELASQERRLAQTEDTKDGDDGNREFRVKQEASLFRACCSEHSIHYPFFTNGLLRTIFDRLHSS